MPEGHLCFFKLGLYISDIHSTSTVNNLEFYIKFVYSTIYIYRTWDNAFAYTWNCNFEIKSICKTPISILLSISRFYRLHSSRPCHCHTLPRWITYSPERLGVGCLIVCCLYFRHIFFSRWRTVQRVGDRSRSSQLDTKTNLKKKTLELDQFIIML